MLKSRFRLVLGLLFVLLGPVHGRQDSKPDCNAQAWARAPDLTPNTVIQGDAGVKISAECPSVANVSLGLRFKERSFVKALRSREDLKWLQLHPDHMEFDIWNTSPWTLKRTRFPNQNAQQAYEEIVANRDLWIVREEERTVFETTQPFQEINNGNDGALLDVVHSFAILVASTNFPPALDILNPPFSVPGDNEEIANVEWMYEYFAQISFEDGTTKEVSAGLTAFQPLHDPVRAPRGLASATMELESLWDMGGKGSLAPITNYSVEISTDNSLMFSAGTKNQVITAVVTRTGPAREFSAPLYFSFCVGSNLLEKWAAEYGIPDSLNRRNRVPTSVLRAAAYDGNPTYRSLVSCFCPGPGSPKVAVVMPNSTADEIRVQEIVTTSSEPFTVSIDVDDAQIFDFETSYQTLANALMVGFRTRRAGDELKDSDDPSAEYRLDRVSGREFEDDEEWVPRTKKPGLPGNIPNSYMGRVPIVVRPAGEIATSQGCLRESVGGSGQAVLSDERSCSPSLVHYLDKGARGPIFVDHSIVHELLVQDPEERELRAPILEPVVTSPPQGEERIYRYFRPSSPGKQLVYVGETWVKRVVNKNKHASSSNARGPRVVQSHP